MPGIPASGHNTPVRIDRSNVQVDALVIGRNVHFADASERAEQSAQSPSQKWAW